ncbi:MAG: GlsB/YeaQ/YmgE family stress response membrane protein [Nostoc sp.]|uniref:GlsB/YeaQ/YmgE family stress response membrane protein n=1 Tax=Nostoc sp. TaxID=1180 RepID=UPI002FF46A44
MSIIAWVVLGLLAGAMPTAGYAYAKTTYPDYQGGGIVSTIVLGIIGAFVSGSLFTLIQAGTLQNTAAAAALTLPGILVALLGAIVTIYLLGLIRRSSNA